jgi:curved DNA-binding protein CbpA
MVAILFDMTEVPEESFIDYYAALGVEPHVDEATLRAAFLHRAKDLHPDTGGEVEDMQQLNLAYATLRNVTKRRAYDLLHQFHTGRAELHYRTVNEPTSSATSDMSDNEIDEFINQVFREYAIKPPKKPRSAILKDDLLAKVQRKRRPKPDKS